MLLITCPFCGERDEAEFVYGGQAHLVRPDPATADDATWARYLYYRGNPRGETHERWLHARGCRRWFNAVRDTRSHRFLTSYPMGSEPPPR